MDQKLTKFKLFLKKYWLYIALAFAFTFGIIFALLGGGKDNVWFRSIKKLMGLLNKTQDELHEIHRQGQQKEDRVRQDEARKEAEVNAEALKQQAANQQQRDAAAANIVDETKDDPEKMGNAFGNAFGIPQGNKNE